MAEADEAIRAEEAEDIDEPIGTLDKEAYKDGTVIGNLRMESISRTSTDNVRQMNISN